MPAGSRRVHATQNIRFTKTAHAPLRYVYDWCTDYREDDGKFSQQVRGYTVLRPAPGRVVRIRESKPVGKPPVIAIELVRLEPPYRWHVDQIDETDLAACDYRLTKLGPTRTKIELRITERWMTSGFPDRSEYRTTVSRYWDDLVRALEARYTRGLPAKG